MIDENSASSSEYEVSMRHLTCGVKDWTLHSLRRTAATNLGKLKVQPHVIQSVLAHSWGGITARYNRFDYFDEKRAAVLLWEAKLASIVA